MTYRAPVSDIAFTLKHSAGLKRATQVWSAMNNARVRVRLFKHTWMNPLPDTEIVSIDYESTMADSAPFLIAVTAEP